MIDFYINKLGERVKVVTKAKAYLNDTESNYYQFAKTDPEKIIIVYIEMVPIFYSYNKKVLCPCLYQTKQGHILIFKIVKNKK